MNTDTMVGATGTTDPAQELFDRFEATDRAVLARCGCLNLFDAEMYSAVLQINGETGLAGLVRKGMVEVLPGADEMYRVSPLFKSAAWSWWFVPGENASPPTGLAEFANTLQAYCAKSGQEVERLRALLLVDQQLAAEWFLDAFSRCDARLDIAGCRNLLAALTEPDRRIFVGPVLAETCDDRRRYLAARARFAGAILSSATDGEYGRRGRYLPRPALERRTNRLLSDEGLRAVRLSGSGGYGKSTLLKWLVARQCVPNGYPCAWIDLDVVDPVNATRHPWLVILEIAHQLNEQLPGAPFQELLREHSPYRAVLARRPSSLAGSGAATLTTLSAQVDADDVHARFRTLLQETASRVPVVIVLDTFEEAALRPSGDAAALVALLASVVEACSFVKLLIAGRLTAAETSNNLLSDLHFEVEEITVPPFSEQESSQYLLDVRRLQSAELVDGIIDRAGGLPWQLAVWGDVVEQYPALTPDMLDQVQPDVAWAVDRVLARIDDDRLCWLLRYGAVPRRLSRDFAMKVILPRMAGRWQAPTTINRNEIRPRRMRCRSFGPAGRYHPGPEFDEMWRKLTSYAATTSWMWIAPGDDDAVILHPELRGPMRKLVAAQEVHRLLHRDAVAYYSRLATTDGSLWALWKREAIYHAFQLDPELAVVAWHEALGQARERASAEAIAEVAGEILGPEYLDDEGNPRLLAGRPILYDVTIGAAHSEQAWAISRIALRRHLPGSHTLWSQVDSAVRAARRRPAAPGTENRLIAAEAALLSARGDHRAALALLDSMVGDEERDPVDQGVILVLHAEVLRLGGFNERSLQTLRRGRETVRRVDAQEVAARMAVALAAVYSSLGRLDEAGEELRQTIDSFPALADDLEIRRATARVALDIGHPASALAVLLNAGSDVNFAAEIAEAHRALADPLAAIEVCTRELASAFDPPRHAAVLMMRGRAKADLLDGEGALADLIRARDVLFQIPDVEGAGMATAHAAAVQLRIVGNVREARQYLRELVSLKLQPGTPAWTLGRLLRAEMESRFGSPEAAAGHAREALKASARTAEDPRFLVNVAIAAFSHAPELSETVADLLAWNVPQITPISARLRALNGLDACPTWSWGNGLMAIVLESGDDWSAHASPADKAYLQIRISELLRIAGLASESSEMLWEAGHQLRKQPLIEWVLLQAIIRVRPASVFRLADSLPPVHYDNWPPLLRTAYSLTIAEQLLALGELAGATWVLNSAPEFLPGLRITLWQAKYADLRVREAQLRGHEEDVEHFSHLGAAARTELGDLRVDTQDDPESGGLAGPREAGTFRAQLGHKGELLIQWGQVRRELPADHPLASCLHSELLLQNTGKSQLVYWLRDQLAGAALIDLDDPGLLLADGQEIDIPISAPGPLAQLPWELASFSGCTLAEAPGVRHVYRAVTEKAVARKAGARTLQEELSRAGFGPGTIDGYVGPETQRALSLFQSTAGLDTDAPAGPLTWQSLRTRVEDKPHPGVLVVRRDPEFEMTVKRGYLSGGGAEIEAMYHALGWRVRSISCREFLQLTEYELGDRIDLIHLNASMETSGAVTYLDFGVDTTGLAYSYSGALTVTEVDKAVRLIARQGHRTPLVILDVAATPKLGSETIRQSLLRNDFAHQLMGLGRCYAVLATGLAPERLVDYSQEILFKALGSGETVADVARSLRQETRSTPDSSITFAATALFLAVPPDELPTIR